MTKIAAIPTNLSNEVVGKKNDYSHYVDVGCTLTKGTDIAIWNALVEANPNLKKTDIIRIALHALHASLE